MVISRTPFRISFVGGATDLREFYQHEAGAVVSTAIDKYMYITVSKKFDHRIRVSYSITEMVDKVDEIQHDLVREVLKYVGIKSGIEITSIADIPSKGTGLGSSSSYVVGLLNALYAFQGQHKSANELAKAACDIEIEILKKPIGKQDQYIAAHGGLQYIQFNPDDSVFADPIIFSKESRENLEKNLLIFYTGVTRSADKILSKQKENYGEKHYVLHRMKDLAAATRDALRANQLEDFGKLLDENWYLKKQLQKEISNPQIDVWYQKAIKAGALGGKLLGAGGGGFLLFYVPEKNQEKVRLALKDLEETRFNFEPQGSKIIYVE